MPLTLTAAAPGVVAVHVADGVEHLGQRDMLERERNLARDVGTIDLRPVFRPRSIAVVGASPRSWIAETVRDNLRLMDSATRCHFVNPKYDELYGQP